MPVDLQRLRIISSPAANTRITLGLTGLDDTRPHDPSIGERRLGRFILPPFQRPAVWDRERQVRLIESVWLGLPIAAFVYNQVGTVTGDRSTDMWLIDGQQRWTAIYAYLDDAFEVHGRTFSELSVEERRAFRHSTFPYIQLDSTDPVMLRDVYDRLAYGGVAHGPEEEPAPIPGP